MKTRLFWMVGVFLMVTLPGCGKSSEVLSYEFSVNGCETGKHEFQSREAYCAALLDDSLNRGCAYSIRMETHKVNCSK